MPLDPGFSVKISDPFNPQNLCCLDTKRAAIESVQLSRISCAWCQSAFLRHRASSNCNIWAFRLVLFVFVDVLTSLGYRSRPAPRQAAHHVAVEQKLVVFLISFSQCLPPCVLWYSTRAEKTLLSLLFRWVEPVYGRRKIRIFCKRYNVHEATVLLRFSSSIVTFQQLL